jgi:hypothetical protein
MIEVRTILKRGDHERLRQLVQELEALPADEEEIWNMIPLAFICWPTVILRGEGAQLVGRLREAQQRLSEAGDPPVMIRNMAWLTLAYARAGQLHRAQQEGRAALALLEQSGGRTPVAGYLW